MGIFDNQKFRCHSLGNLMSSPRGFGITEKQLSDLKELQGRETRTAKQTETMQMLEAKLAKYNEDKLDPVKCLSDTAKAMLDIIYIEKVYKRTKPELNTKQITKGTEQEEQGINLSSDYDDALYFKNETRFENEYLSGEPDVVYGDLVIDIKCSWDIFTFEPKARKPDSLYAWQGWAYNWLTNTSRFKLSYCLVNTPYSMLQAEKQKLWYNYDHPNDSEDHPDYIKAAKEMEKRFIYDYPSFMKRYKWADLLLEDWTGLDIPIHERIISHEFQFDETKIEQVESRLKACREYLNRKHEAKSKLRKIAA